MMMTLEECATITDVCELLEATYEDAASEDARAKHHKRYLTVIDAYQDSFDLSRKLGVKDYLF